MKMHITKADLAQLTDEQKRNLNIVWVPEIYDACVANICIDESKDLYGDLEFVVGGIQLLERHGMLLHDIKFVPDSPVEIKSPADQEADLSEAEEDVEGQNEIPEENEEFEEDESETEPDFDFCRPTSFNKEDCLPLLNIGQMIQILSRKNFGEGDFYLTAAIGDYFCDMGKHDAALGSVDENAINAELCDVLWESVKAII